MWLANDEITDEKLNYASASEVKKCYHYMYFVSTYLGKTGFSNYAAIQTKYRNRLNAAQD
jgi:hypothetical protein